MAVLVADGVLGRVDLLGENEGVAVVGQVVSWGEWTCWDWMKVWR